MPVKRQSFTGRNQLPSARNVVCGVGFSHKNNTQLTVVQNAGVIFFYRFSTSNHL